MTVLLSRPLVKGRRARTHPGVSIASPGPPAPEPPPGPAPAPAPAPTGSQTGSPTGPRRIPCVGAVVHDERGRLLLIRRAHPPAQGTWSLPGGRVEAGEDDAAAIVREVAEETGLSVEPGRVVGTVKRDSADGGVYVITDLICRVAGGSLQAGDDASDADWFDARRLASTTTSPGLIDTLAEWGVLPR
jgi:8-oxo-dGTP diphosphatase